MEFASIDELEEALRGADYLPDRGLSTALYLSLMLSKPVLLEGEAGVGKTEAAKALATVLGARLIRLQCYEGLDVAHAVYEWNYPRQLLHIRAAQEGTLREEELFGPEYLIRRPLLDLRAWCKASKASATKPFSASCWAYKPAVCSFTPPPG